MQKLRPLLIPDGENTYWLKAYSRALPEPTLEHRLAKTHKLLSKKYLKQRTFHPLLCQAVVCEKLCRLRAVFLCCPRASNLLSSHYAFSRFGSSQEIFDISADLVCFVPRGGSIPRWSQQWIRAFQKECSRSDIFANRGNQNATTRMDRREILRFP